MTEVRAREMMVVNVANLRYRLDEIKKCLDDKNCDLFDIDLQVERLEREVENLRYILRECDEY